MKIIEVNGTLEHEYIDQMKKREEGIDLEFTEQVAKILSRVRQFGDDALREYGTEFDGGVPTPFQLGQDQMKEAYQKADPSFRAALELAKENIKEFHEKQRVDDYEIQRADGVRIGMQAIGLNRVGLYVPGGRASYPSTVLMNGIPAKLAGVKELIMVTPPMTERKGNIVEWKANPDILTAAYIAGVDHVFLTGGAQAVAALAYGTKSIPKVDKIVGPGNIYVATAKRLVYGIVDIDMIAGPSEILILADQTANPAFLAADLLSQAEHDPMAAAILITDSETIAKETLKELDTQKRKLDRQEIIESSLRDHGVIFLCRDRDTMFSLANEIAPEHLELMMENPLSYLSKIENAGSVFCGDYSPEPLGDYFAGCNHVLPTSGTARFASPLGVYDFLKRRSYTYYTKEALAMAKKHIQIIADREGLSAHGESVNIRFSDSIIG